MCVCVCVCVWWGSLISGTNLCNSVKFHDVIDSAFADKTFPEAQKGRMENLLTAPVPPVAPRAARGRRGPWWPRLWSFLPAASPPLQAITRDSLGERWFLTCPRNSFQRRTCRLLAAVTQVYPIFIPFPRQPGLRGRSLLFFSLQGYKDASVVGGEVQDGREK